MNRPEFIYFDIDDTLLDHLSAQRSALESVHAEFPCLNNVSLQDFQQAYKKVNTVLWHRYSLGEIDRLFLEKHRFTDTFDVLDISCVPYKDIVEFYMNDYRNHWSWMTGAKEALNRISESYEVGFITNGFSETQKLKVTDFELERFSDKVIISEDVGYLKPSPEIFYYAEKAAGKPGERILYVGDSYTSDVKGGKSVGWKVAWFTRETNGNHLRDADFVFDEFEKLTDYLL